MPVFTGACDLDPHDDRLADELRAVHGGPPVGECEAAEPKRELVKRLGRSPDRLDAALLALYAPFPGRMVRFG